MDKLSFAITYDYRCPFARIVNDHLVTAFRAGAPFDVSFVPFVLGGVYVTEGGPKIWDIPEERVNLKALAVSIVVMERAPEHFLDVHDALFELRHAQGGNLRDDATLSATIEKAGADPDLVLRELAAGWPYDVLRESHERAMAEHDVWGVPTFIANGHAAFVRLMSGPKGDAKVATQTIEMIVNLLVEHPELNEFKHTTVPN